jgi:hypothetical protein
VKLVDMLIHGPKSTNVIDLIGDGRSTAAIRQIWTSTSQISKIGPRNHRESLIYEQRSMVGKSLRSAKVKSANMLVTARNQLTSLISLGMEYQQPRLDRFRQELPRFRRLGLAIVMNRRYVNGDRWWGIIAKGEGEINRHASSQPKNHQRR